VLAVKLSLDGSSFTAVMLVDVALSEASSLPLGCLFIYLLMSSDEVQLPIFSSCVIKLSNLKSIFVFEYPKDRIFDKPFP